MGAISVGLVDFLLNKENFFFASSSDNLYVCFIKSSASGDLPLTLNSLIYL